MANIEQNTKFSRGQQVTAGNLNDVASTSTISNIQNSDIDASAGVVDTKLATISSNDKVNSTALTLASQTAGDILYNTGSAWARLPIGTAGQKLKITGGELDYMEYATDGAAQAAYVTSDTPVMTSQYPTAHSDTYVKATSKVNTNYCPYFATDPALSLTGVASLNAWLSASGSYTNQRFHIDLGSAKAITKIYYENYHDSGTGTDYGVKNFTLWGSNSAAAFAELTYGTDTGWTQITGLSQSTFDQHAAADSVDPKYITFTNTTAYRYYAFKFADNYEAVPANFMGFRRLELQMNIYTLQSYSESTLMTQGTYSLKGVALVTDSLNKTLTRTIGSPLNFSGVDTIYFDIRSNRTGGNIKIGIHDSGGTTTEKTHTISSANVFETVTWDISAVSNANKDAIDSIIVTITNADAANTFYIDNFYGNKRPTWITP